MEPHSVPRLRALWLPAAIAVTAWVGACVDERRVTGDEEPVPAPWPGIVSDPVSSSASAVSGSTRSLRAFSGSDVVYVSLVPGTIPNGELAVIRNRGTGSAVVAAMVAGGLDPVPVVAAAGDTLDINVRVAGSDSTLHFSQVVAAARRPRVVRTDPSRGKRDVTLNAVIVIVFSEPIDATTLTESSVQVLRGTEPVAGQLELRDPANLTVVFVPAALLAAATTYQLSVTQGIRDLDGDSLEAPESVEFATASPVAVSLVAAVVTWTDVSGVGAWGVVSAPIEYYVAATDASGNGVTGVTIDWAVTAGGGSVAPTQNTTSDSMCCTTFPQPVARATHTLGPGEGLHTVTVTANGVPGAPRATLSTRAVHGLVGLDQFNGFYPADVAVPVGTTVAWIWNDGCCPAEHDVVFEDDPTEPLSSPRKTDPAYHTRTFAAAGTYRYRCTNHSQDWALGEVGSVTVGDAPAAQPQRIAFSGNGIQVIHHDGSGLATLTDGGYPAWSPDGSRIAFVRSWALYVMHDDGSNVQFVHDGFVEPGTFSASGVHHPAWSPDGTRIAFAFDFWFHDGQFVQETGNLHVVNADGSGAQTLFTTVPAVWYWHPAWSPDGTRIAFLRQNAVDPQYELMVVGADGSGLTKLAEDAGAPAWSPDGSRIAFHSAPGYCDQGGYGRSCGLYVMNADGTGVVELLADTTDVVHPTWSPDGSKIAFARWVDDISQYDIYVMNSDGSGVTRVTNRPGWDWYPKWSPVRSGTPTNPQR